MKTILRIIIVIIVLEVCTFSLQFTDIHGRWKLLYKGNYGYEFRFAKNYQAVCIIYLQNNAVVFKGVYTLDNPQTLRININQMKNLNSIATINIATGFSQVKSSYFIFNAAIIPKNNKKMLELKPINIVIDGNNSEGYFEPTIFLERQ